VAILVTPHGLPVELHPILTYTSTFGVFAGQLLIDPIFRHACPEHCAALQDRKKILEFDTFTAFIVPAWLDPIYYPLRTIASRITRDSQTILERTLPILTWLFRCSTRGIGTLIDPLVEKIVVVPGPLVGYTHSSISVDEDFLNCLEAFFWNLIYDW
jgi:hypothetical protein